MPGDPAGMPGTANPMAVGRLSSNRRTAAAGTCPSSTYPSTSAVWQAARSAGTPNRALTGSRSVVVVRNSAMGLDCCDHHSENPHAQSGDRAYRRILWTVLAINAAMFAIEIGAGVAAGSASLQADALDFLGDAANYAISLFVVGMGLRYRAMAALAKGSTMGVFGLWVIGVTAWHAWHGTIPQAATMGAVGFTAL